MTVFDVIIMSLYCHYNGSDILICPGLYYRHSLVPFFNFNHNICICPWNKPDNKNIQSILCIPVTPRVLAIQRKQFLMSCLPTAPGIQRKRLLLEGLRQRRLDFYDLCLSTGVIITNFYALFLKCDIRSEQFFFFRAWANKSWSRRPKRKEFNGTENVDR